MQPKGLLNHQLACHRSMLSQAMLLVNILAAPDTGLGDLLAATPV